MGIFGDIQKPYRPFESWFYDRYIAPGLQAWTPAILEEIKPFLNALPDNASILDVGCGGGQLIVGLAGVHGRLRFTGVDLSKEQIARARARGAPFGERMRFVEGSATALPFLAASFDLVVSIGSLKHWTDRAKGLAECVRVLRPGRGLVVTDADRESSPEDFERMVRAMRLPRLVVSILKVTSADRMIRQSPDQSDLRTWLAALPVKDIDVHRLTQMPAWVAKAVKRDLDA